MSEGRRSYLDRQPDANKRSLAAAIEPGLRLIESIRSRYLDQVQGRVCRTKATSSPMNPLCVNPTHFGLIDDRIVFVAPVERFAPFDAVSSTLCGAGGSHSGQEHNDSQIKRASTARPNQADFLLGRGNIPSSVGLELGVPCRNPGDNGD